MRMKNAAKCFCLMIIVLSILMFPLMAQAKSMELDTESDMRSVKLSWKKVTGAVSYKVYRADVTKCVKNYKPDPKKSKYKKIVTTQKKTFRDRKMRAGRYYAYYVNAISRKGKVINSTWTGGAVNFVRRGMERPELMNNGYGENFTNSAKKLHIMIIGDDMGISARPDKFIVYRRENGQKKYRKLKAVRFRNLFYEDVADGKVTPGKTYYYKVKALRKEGGKTFCTKMSHALKIPAVNFVAKYKVHREGEITELDDGSHSVTVSLENASSINGKTVIENTEGFFVPFDIPDDSNRYDTSFRFTEYSRDKISWKKVTGKGVTLPKKGKLYLRGKAVIQGFDLSEAGKKKFMITSEGGLMRYYGNGAGETYATLDFSAGKGRAYMEWD